MLQFRFSGGLIWLFGSEGFYHKGGQHWRKGGVNAHHELPGKYRVGNRRGKFFYLVWAQNVKKDLYFRIFPNPMKIIGCACQPMPQASIYIFILIYVEYIFEICHFCLKGGHPMGRNICTHKNSVSKINILIPSNISEIYIWITKYVMKLKYQIHVIYI